MSQTTFPVTAQIPNDRLLMAAACIVCVANSTACGNASGQPYGVGGGRVGVLSSGGSPAADAASANGGSDSATPWDASPSTQSALRIIPVRWIHASGSDFVDEKNNALRLVGVGLSNDAWGIYVWPESDTLTQQGKDPLIRPTELYSWCLNDVDFDKLAGLPINVVRYSFAYEMFAADNAKLEANLATLESNIARLGALGIYTVLNDNMPIGLDGESDSYERNLPPSEREQSIFENDDYFAKDLAMWQMLAQRLANRPELLAYELINEPRVPSPSEGGQLQFQQRLQALVSGIHAVDPRHIVLVPEWNSQEGSDPNQTVSWNQGMVKVDDDNVGYVLHLYTPYEFTSAGAASYDPAAVLADLERRIDWRDTVGHAPLIATEYGVNRGQPMDRRLDWTKYVHGLFSQNGISSIWFNYKADASAYVDVKSVFALAEQYVKMNDEITQTAAGWSWASAQTATAAETNGFDTWYQTYFVGLTPNDVSWTDSQPLIDELLRYQLGQ